LVEADVVLTSTGSPEPVITLERCNDLARRRRYRPLLIIDVAVPRDVEDAVGKLENVFLYDIDDLQRITEQHWEERRSRADVGERMVEEGVREFLQERARRDVGPVVTQLRDHLKGLAEAELEWLTPKLKAASEQDRILVAQMLHRVINKVLHHPTQALNEKGQEGLGQVYAEVVRRLFGLEEDDE
jgi:glutamyl-tRNA reductase